MNVWSGTPAEPEQADRNTKCADKCGREPLLWLDLAVFVELWFQFVSQVEKERWDDYENADEDTQERKSFFANVEMIDSDKDVHK